MPNITQAIKDNISILAYAEMIGLHPVRRGGQRESWTLKEHDSLVIKPDAKGTHQWFIWNSTGQKGSVIDFAAAINGWSIPQAISELRKELGSYERPPIRAAPTAMPQYASASETQKNTVFSLPAHSSNGQGRVFAYLCKTRGLSGNIVSSLVHEKKIYQDIRGNAVFVGMDYDGMPKYGTIRGTHSDIQFRGDVSGSDKKIGFSMGLVGESPTRLLICEAPIDAISIASMLEHFGRDPASYAYLALGGTSINALEYHLPHHSQLKTIYLCQDNDAAGNKSRAACRTFLEKAGYAGHIIDKPPMSKDFNDDLLAIRAAAQQPQQSLTQDLTIRR